MTTQIERKKTDMHSFIHPQPWSVPTAPPCLDSGHKKSGQSNYYQTPNPYPWRPTTGYEDVDIFQLPEQPITNQTMSPCFVPKGMSTDPLIFPNLVTGFERNPQHAARAALYTRYTPAEWTNHCIQTYAEADSNKNFSERLRAEAIRVMRETDERTAQGQRDAGRRIGERITDVTFWRNELSQEIEKLISETELLSETKRKVAKALQDLEAPLHIAQECLYHREGRQHIEKVHDHVEKSILIEIDNLKSSQEKLINLLDKVNRQLSNSRAAQFTLEDDLVKKESALGIDSVCHKLNNYSRGINYYGGIEKYDPTSSVPETWSAACSAKVNKAQTERGKSAQLRSDSETIINGVATSVWDMWSNTNNSLNKRASELLEAKSRVQLHLHKTQQEIFDIDKNIDLLRKAMQDKSNPLKVAQTRLEARTHRTGVEGCKDFAQMRLIQEVCDIQDSVTNLHRKLQEAEAQYQQLLRTRSNLETDLKNKVNALFIDREKCMGMRRSFPVSSIIKY